MKKGILKRSYYDGENVDIWGGTIVEYEEFTEEYVKIYFDKTNERTKKTYRLRRLAYVEDIEEV